MLSLVLLPILIFPTVLSIGIAVFVVWCARLGSARWQQWAWTFALSVLFTFGTRLPDFIVDFTDSYEAEYVIHEPIELWPEDVIGLSGGQQEFRLRPDYFKVSGLKGNAGSVQWGRPSVGHYNAFELLEHSYDIQNLGDQSASQGKDSDPSYPVVKIQSEPTPTHDQIEIEVWRRGRLHAKYAQRTRVWFRDEVWANANSTHTALFLMKSTIWNMLAKRDESKRARPSEFLKAALVKRESRREVQVHEPELKERILRAAPSSYRDEDGKFFALKKHCTHTDFPQTLKSSSLFLRGIIADRHIKRYLPDPVVAEYRDRKPAISGPQFGVRGISCGKDGYLVVLESKRWERIKDLYQRLILLDKDFRPVGVLTAKLQWYQPTQTGRIVDFRQQGDVVTVLSLLRDEGEANRFHQAEFKHTALSADFATDANPAGTVEALAAIDAAAAEKKRLSREKEEIRRTQKQKRREKSKLVEKGIVDNRAMSTDSKNHLVVQRSLRAPPEAVAILPRKSDAAARLGYGLNPNATAHKRISRARARTESGKAQELKDYPLVTSSWKDRYPMDVYLPPRGFMALYFNTNDPKNIIHREEVGRVAINYIWDKFKGIPSQDFGGLWYGRLETDRLEEYDLKIGLSWSEARVIIDDYLVYETGRRMPTLIAVPRGTYSILVEYTNNWHTTKFQFDLQAVNETARNSD